MAREDRSTQDPQLGEPGEVGEFAGELVLVQVPHGHEQRGSRCSKSDEGPEAREDRSTQLFQLGEPGDVGKFAGELVEIQMSHGEQRWSRL